MLWELLTGRRLFKGESDTATQRLVRTCQVPPPSTLGANLPKDLDAIVLKALAKNREDRYADAGALRMALEEYATSKGIPSSPAHMVNFLRPFYVERIDAEKNPETLDELTSEEELGFAAKSGALATPAGPPVPGRVTEAVAPKKPSKAWVGLAAVAVLAVGGFAVFKALQPKPVEKPVEVPHIAVPDPVVKPPEPFAVRIESEPAGADVERDGSRLGVTPLDLKLERAKLPATLRLSRDGFEPKETVVSEASGPLLSLQLKKKTRVVTGPRPPDIKTNR